MPFTNPASGGATVVNNVTATSPANLTVKNLFGANPYGAGYDGALSIIAPTVQTRDLQCTNLTVAPANGLLTLDECTFAAGIGGWINYLVGGNVTQSATWNQGGKGYLGPNTLLLTANQNAGSFQGVSWRTGIHPATVGDSVRASVLVRNNHTVATVTMYVSIFTTTDGSTGQVSPQASVTIPPGQSKWISQSMILTYAGASLILGFSNESAGNMPGPFSFDVLYAAMVDGGPAIYPTLTLDTAGFRALGTGTLDVTGIIANDGGNGSGTTGGTGAPAGSLAGGGAAGVAPTAATVEGGTGGGGPATAANPLIILDTQALTSKTYSGGSGGLNYGGGGGGVIFLAFPTMALSGVVRARGGDALGSNQGGGGGGGLVLLVYTTRSGNLPDVSGGNPYGAGVAGSPGSVGEVVV